MAKRSKTTPSQPAPAKWRNRIVRMSAEDPQQLLANPFNFRIHTAIQERALSQSLEVLGWIDVVIVNEPTQHVIDGHLRIVAAISKHEPTVPVLWVNLTEEEEKIALLSLDPIAALAGTSQEQAADLIAQVGGSVDAAVRELLSGTDGTRRRTGVIGAPAAPREPERIVVKVGDVWELGDHRILCGDATRVDDVDLLLGGERVDLLGTDPPYGVMYGQGGSGKKNAIRGDLSQAAIPISFAVAVERALMENGRIYLCGGSTNLQMYWALFDHHLRMMPRLIVWAKESFIMRPNNYHSQFELIFYGWRGKGGDPKYWFSDRKGENASDVWQIPRDADPIHPTQKPVELMARMIRNSTPARGRILEPFAGGGSTCIAAEELGRTCLSIDIDPKWVQVTIDRWEATTGEKAKRLPPSTAAAKKRTKR